MTETEKRLEDYRRLIAIARDLASTLDLDALLDRITHAAADLTGAEAASILLYDDAARQLNFQVSTNLDLQTMHGLVVPLEGSVAGWVVHDAGMPESPPASTVPDVPPLPPLEELVPPLPVVVLPPWPAEPPPPLEVLSSPPPHQMANAPTKPNSATPSTFTLR